MRLLEKYIRECSEVIDHMNEDLNKIPDFEAQIHKDNESFIGDDDDLWIYVLSE